MGKTGYKLDMTFGFSASEITFLMFSLISSVFGIILPQVTAQT